MIDKFLASQLDLKNGLSGQFLVAMPGMVDERFANSVILISNHDSDGAMGFVINKAQDIQMSELLIQMELIEEQRLQNLPSSVDLVDVRYGGPMDRSRGFVIHSTDYTLHSTERLTVDLSVSSSLDILNGISHGAGPEKAIMVLGYAGWAQGQLEGEIANNAWLNLPSNADSIFVPNVEDIHKSVLASSGIDLQRLSSYSGLA